MEYAENIIIPHLLKYVGGNFLPADGSVNKLNTLKHFFDSLLGKMNVSSCTSARGGDI